MTKACLLILAGGFAAQHSRVSPGSDLCYLAMVASILMLAHARSRAAGSVLLGFALFMLAGQDVIERRLDARFAGDSLLTRVRVVDFPVAAGASLTFVVEPIDDRRLPPRSRVRWFEPPEQAPRIGDVWQLELRLKRPRGYSNPGAFDREALLFRQRMHATGYVVSGKRNRRLGSGELSGIDSVRREFVDRAHRAAASEPAAAVLAAIGVGARHGIADEQWRRYARTGTSHLVAISGLHVGLAAACFSFLAMVLLGIARVPINSFRLGLLTGLAAAACYVAVSGWGVPARRALLMLVIGVATVSRRRQADAAPVLAVTAAAVFIDDPLAAMAPGFHLSFAAVALLAWFARRLQVSRAPASRWRRLADGALVLLRVQVFLFIGLAPLTMLLFNRLAPLSIPVNLAGVPLFSFVTVPATLFGLLLGGVSEAMAQPALKIAALSIDGLERLIVFADGTRVSDLPVARARGLTLIALSMPAIWVALPRRWPGRHLAIIGLPAMLLQAPHAPPPGCADAHVLDVGQGLAVVLQTPSSTGLYDTGIAFRGGGSIAEHVVLPFLRARAVRNLDWIVVSHADIDHSGGIGTVLEYSPQSRVLTGEPLAVEVPGAGRCRSGQRWQEDGVRFSVLHPAPGNAGTGNNASCVLLVEIGAHALLLTGDIEARAERALLRNGSLRAVDVVVVPHHGSLTSSSGPFAARLAPAIAVVPAGFRNRWGFPKQAVVDRWRRSGADVLVTGRTGAVSLRLCARDGIRRVQKDRDARRRFWREAMS